MPDDATPDRATGTDTPIYDALASTVPGFTRLTGRPPGADPNAPVPRPAERP